MKITEYPAIRALEDDNVFLVDGPNGTKIITAADLPFALMDRANVAMHRMMFRGKNIGTSLTETQKMAIQEGTFDDIWLGDYWTINGINWRVADFNYWYNRGDTALTSNHVVVVPETNLYSAKMNDSSITTGGYTGSKMYTSNLATAKSTISSAFGSNVLSHREYLINAVTSGYPSAGTWVDSSVDLMNEQMVFGSHIYTPAGDGTNIVKRYSNSCIQLALFMVCPQFINSTSTGQRISYWLRDVVSSSRFVRVTDYGPATETASSLEYGVRPAFAVG